MAAAYAAASTSYSSEPSPLSDQLSQNEGPQLSSSSPATRAYKETASKMLSDMVIPYSKDADEDFATSLTAHHKGGVALAQAELHYGADNKMRQLAEAAIENRTHERALIAAWQAKHVDQ